MLPTVLLLAPMPDFLTEMLTPVCQWHSAVPLPENEELINRHAATTRGLVIFGATTLTEALLDRFPALEIISVFGVGYDGVPISYCKARGIRVSNTPDVLTDDVADIAVALVLMTSRGLMRANRFLHNGDWHAGAFPLTHCLRGKVAGILGLGRIGQAIAQRLSAHGMQIHYHGRRPQEVPYTYWGSVQELAKQSDFLIVACPGGPETIRLVDAEVLTALGENGTLVNIARGSVVDETALMEALEAGRIRAAGLDVFEAEPHVPEALLRLPNVVALPHVGSGTWETRHAMARLCVDNLEAYLGGRGLLTPVC